VLHIRNTGKTLYKRHGHKQRPIQGGTVGEHIGYIRVSSAGQNTDRQLDGIKLDKIYTEKISGATTKRPQLQECLRYLREHDTLHVHSLDRLARNLADLQGMVDGLTAKGVTIKFHKENLSFSTETTAMNTLMLQMMGAFAQFERSLINERQAEGIAKAQAQGKHLGRPATVTAEQREKLKEMIQAGKPKTEIAQELNISRQSVYRLIKQIG